MQVKRWQEERSFSREKFRKVNLFESERMFCDIYCFEPGQEQALHSHDDNDKIYCVLEGRGTFTVGGESRELDAGWAALRPPGEDHGAVNSSGGCLAVLVFMAPHP